MTQTNNIYVCTTYLFVCKQNKFSIGISSILKLICTSEAKQIAVVDFFFSQKNAPTTASKQQCNEFYMEKRSWSNLKQ